MVFEKVPRRFRAGKYNISNKPTSPDVLRPSRLRYAKNKNLKLTYVKNIT